MKKILKAAVLTLVLLSLATCGSVQNNAGEDLSPDIAAASGKTAVVFNSDFAAGNISTIDMTDLASVKKALRLTDGPDAVLRSFGNRIYVINRYGTDTIQVIDPSTFEVIADYSVGGGSNPYDLVVISDEKAYIARYDAQNDRENGDILIVNPLTGEKLGGIDLVPYTTDDGDRVARAAQMVLVHNILYVCMQDLPANFAPANTNGKVAAIDIDTDTIMDVDPLIAGTQVIELAGRNPSDIAYSSATDTLYVANSGVYIGNGLYETTDGNGGIEEVPRETHKSGGIVIDDADFGGGVAEIRMASENLAYTIVDSTAIASFNPVTREVINRSVYKSAATWLPDFIINSDGNLLIAERDYYNPGVVVVSPGDGKIIAGPIGVGAPPASITFVDIR